MPVMITLNQIKQEGPCERGWLTLLNFQGVNSDYDKPFHFTDLLVSNGLDDALWALRCIPQNYSRKFAIKCAKNAIAGLNADWLHQTIQAAGDLICGTANRRELIALANVAEIHARMSFCHRLEEAGWAVYYAAKSVLEFQYPSRYATCSAAHARNAYRGGKYEQSCFYQKQSEFQCQTLHDLLD